MKSQDFIAWMDATGIHRATEITEKIGLSRNLAQTYLAAVKRGEDVEIKLTVALAMRAVANALPAWGTEMR